MEQDLKYNNKNKELVKSQLNYTGGKFKLLPKILPLFPNNISTFVDLFGGGGNVFINVKADYYIYNDILKPVVDLLKYVHSHNTNDILNEINYYIDKYKLCKTNKASYLNLRKDFNNSVNKSSIMFYVLICYSFNNQIRFNSKGEFNLPIGKRDFNPSLRQKFITFSDELNKLKNVLFTNHSFETLDVNLLNLYYENCFIYCDPPYYNSTATYNEKWTQYNEIELLTLLDNCHKNNIKFALSNNLKYENPFLKQWLNNNKDKYTIHYLDVNYNNCNYQKKDKSKDIEILVTNY